MEIEKKCRERLKTTNGFVFRSEIKNRLALMASFQMCKLPIPCTPFKPSTDNEPHDPSSLWARGHGVHVSKENKNLFDYSEQFSTLPESIWNELWSSSVSGSCARTASLHGRALPCMCGWRGALQMINIQAFIVLHWEAMFWNCSSIFRCVFCRLVNLCLCLRLRNPASLWCSFYNH